MFIFFLFFFFFFQAEDGIRDLYVTGVQTCALPILDRGVIVRGGNGRQRAAGAGGIPQAAGWSRAGEGVGLLRSTTPRRYDAKKRPRAEHQKVAPINLQRSVVASGHGFSPTSRTVYPAWARRAAGDPPGHITISPPSATTIPPYHTHQTKGLMVKRNTACSVPSTVPPSTPYRSSRSMLMMAGSVDGWNVGRPSPSTCCRFSGVRNPIGLPLRRTSTVAAVI